MPFEVIDDGYDTYFMKVPSSWGQLWTATHWEGFRSWYDKGQQITENDYLPDNVIAWPETSWKKYFYKPNPFKIMWGFISYGFRFEFM